MKLSDLLAAVTWADVKAALLRHYPDAEASLKGYQQVFAYLRNREAVASPMRIFIREGFDEKFDEEPFTEVSGRDGTRNRDLEGFQDLTPSVDPEYADTETNFSLALTPWEQWLGMDIDPQTLQAYTRPQIAAHCLWEMTFHGFEPSQVLMCV